MHIDLGNGFLKGAHGVMHAGSRAWGALTARLGPAAAKMVAGGAILATAVTGGGALIHGAADRYAGSLCPPGAIAQAQAVAASARTDAGKDAGGHTDASQEAVAKRIYAVLGGLGMSDENIAGILGNVQAESGFNPGIVQGGGSGGDNQAMLGQVGGSGHAIGLFQWDSGRATALVKYAIAHSKPWSDVDLQLQFLFGGDGANSDIARGMVSNPMGSPEQAAEYWNRTWERSADTSGARAANAKAWFARIGGWEKLSHDEATGLVGSVDQAADTAGSPDKAGGPGASVTPAVLAQCCAHLERQASSQNAPPASGGDAPSAPTAKAFIDRYGDDIDNVARRYNIPAVTIIAQAGAESSYGTAGMAVKANNPWNFGDSPYFQGMHGYLGTGESNSDFTITNWASVADAASGYGMLLATRYQGAFAHANDPKAFAQALQDAGYDGDANKGSYAQRIIGLYPAVEQAAQEAGRTLYTPSAPGNPVGDKVADGQHQQTADQTTANVSEASAPINMCGVTRDASDVAHGSLGSITEACVDSPDVVEKAKKLTGLPDEKLTKAASWAIGVACNNRIGYNQSHQPPLTQDAPTTDGYESTDCSNLIAAALMFAGFGNGLFSTGSEAAELTKAGFREAGTANDVSKLKPGDILWYDSGGAGHTVWYLGQGLDVAAHGSFEGDGIHGSPGDTQANPALRNGLPHGEVSVSAHDTDPQLSHVWRYQG